MWIGKKHIVIYLSVKVGHRIYYLIYIYIYNRKRENSSHQNKKAPCKHIFK